MTKEEIKSGDIVKVVDWGETRSSYTRWFLERLGELKPGWLVRYAYENNENFANYPQKRSDNRNWEVLFVDGDFALITHMNGDGPVYLIKVDALSRSTREMTLSEIEAELGYPVKIIQ